MYGIVGQRRLGIPCLSGPGSSNGPSAANGGNMALVARLGNERRHKHIAASEAFANNLLRRIFGAASRAAFCRFVEHTYSSLQDSQFVGELVE